MDQYSVPVSSRAQWFKFKVFGGWGVAGILFTLLWRCLQAQPETERRHSAEKDQIRAQVRQEAREEMRQFYQEKEQIIKEKTAEIEQYFERLDSLKRKS